MPDTQTDSTVQDAVLHKQRLTPAAQMALVAAVAAGMSQAQAAKEFGVHRNTVSNLCGTVRKVDKDANPLREGFKPRLIQKAVKALEAGLDCPDDPYKRANAGVKTLEGLGVFSQRVETDSVQHITITWGAQPINVTPLESNDKT